MTTNYFIYYLLFAFLFLIIVLAVRLNKIKEEREKYKYLKEEELKNVFKERWRQEEYKFKEKKSELLLEEKEIKGELAQLEVKLKGKEERYNEVNQDLDKYKAGRLEDINILICTKKEEELKKLADEISKEKEKTKTQILILNNELEEIRSRREAVNQEILRQRKLNDDKDFYCIQLDPALTSDISLLRSIAPRLINPTAVNKLIWTAYYQKPLAELRKRLLPDGDYSGIYKITRNKTGEIYIGQTTSIDKRLQDHVKSALGVGTLASSTLHKLMEKDGPENFSFEIIERVDKNKLKEKEAFYIDFYDSKNYGMNSISGVKNGIK